MATNDLWLMKIDLLRSKLICLEHLDPVEKHSYVFTGQLFLAYVTDLPH